MKTKQKSAKATSKVRPSSPLPPATSGLENAGSSSSPWASHFIGYFSVLLCLLIVHLPTLFDPVYWDTILGSFHQAIWLKNNHFDYFELCTTLPSYTMGGAKVYTNSVYPMVQAILMTVIPNTSAHLFLNHIVQIAFAAGTVVILYAVLRRIVSPLAAIGLTGVWISLPMFHSLTATINMDMPTLFFSLLAVLFYMRKQFWPMFAAMIGGILIKQSMAIAIIAITFLSFVRISNLNELKWSLLLLIPLTLSFWGNFVAFFLEPKELTISEQSMHVSDWILKPAEVFERIKTLFYVVPDQTVLLVATLMASIVYGLVFVVRFIKRCMGNSPDKLSMLRAFVAEQEVPLLCSAIIFGFTLLYYSMKIVLPRYAIWIFPFELIFVAALLRRFPRFLAVASVVVVCLNLVNHTGYLYGFVTKTNLHGYAMYLERSMEYHDDLLCNELMAEGAEKYLQETDIVTCWPFTHMLAAPEFGYVKKPLSVVSLNGPGLPALNVPHTSDWLKDRGPNPKQIVYISTIGNFFGPLPFNPQKHNLVHQFIQGDRFINIFQDK